MAELCALLGELSRIIARYGVSDDQDEHDMLGRRLGELTTTINETPPQSLADCLVKLKLLADPDIGMPAGDREDDFLSLRQVVAFLDHCL